MPTDNLIQNATCGHPRYAVKIQKLAASACGQSSAKSPFIVARVKSDHPDPDDFISFAAKGVNIIIIESGIPLQNLVARAALSKVEERPLLWWSLSTNDGTIQEFLLGEETEAGLTGSDGVVIKSSDFINTSRDELNYKIDLCKRQGLLVAFELLDANHLTSICCQPDVYVTAYKSSGYYALQRLQDKEILSVPFISLIHDEGNGESLQNLPKGTGLVVSEYNNLPDPSSNEEITHRVQPIVKVCGIKTVEAARVALENGANMIGMILVPGRSRTVTKAAALEISKFVHGYKRRFNDGNNEPFFAMLKSRGGSVFEMNWQIVSMKTKHRPAIVGVFRNQPLEDVLFWQHELQLDFVQLHGDEPLEWCRNIPVPVIKRFTPNTLEFETASTTGFHYMSLLDGEIGGEGKLVEWSSLQDQVRLGARFILAGGLNSANVTEALKVPGVCGVDVSGGVETHGEKNLDKIRSFVQNARSIK